MRRSKYEICADILRATINGARKTHIVYATNLNFNLVNRYLPRLMERGFIDVSDNGYYSTTEKGGQFLKEYNDLVVLMNADRGDAHEFLVQTREGMPDDSQVTRHTVY